MTHPVSAISKFRRAQGGMSLEEFGKLFTPSVDKSTVQRWEQGRITADRCVEVEGLTGIPRERLRPDLFARREAAE